MRRTLVVFTVLVAVLFALGLTAFADNNSTAPTEQNFIVNELPDISLVAREWRHNPVERLTPPRRYALPSTPIIRRATNYRLHTAWIEGKRAFYYEFGRVTNYPNNIYFMYYQSNNHLVAGQRPIFERCPSAVLKGYEGDPDYNDFARIVIVYVPDTYQLNSVTSYKEIVNKGFPLSPTLAVVNYPVVNAKSTLQNDPEHRRLEKGWFNGETIYYFAFEGEVRQAPKGDNYFRRPLKINDAGAIPFVYHFDYPQWPDIQYSIVEKLADKKYLSGITDIRGDLKYSPIASIVTVYPRYYYTPNHPRSEAEAKWDAYQMTPQDKPDDVINGWTANGTRIYNQNANYFTGTYINRPFVEARIVPRWPDVELAPKN